LSDYAFTRNDDGSVSVERDGETDTLHDIGGIWFNGEGAWYDIDQAVEQSGDYADDGDDAHV